MLRLWDESTAKFPIRNLISIASNFVYPKNDENKMNRAYFLDNATATYFDKDGVEITMSSDDELEDAVLRFLRELDSKPLNAREILDVTVRSPWLPVVQEVVPSAAVVCRSIDFI